MPNTTIKKPGYFVILEDLEGTMIKAQQASAEGRNEAKAECFTAFCALTSSLERFEDIPPGDLQVIINKLTDMSAVLQREVGYDNFLQKLRSLLSNLK